MRNKIDKEHTAASVSQTSMTFFLSHLSLSAPANMLISTYGVYEHIDNSAVCSADPVFAYSHNVSANDVISLTSCDRDCVLHSMPKVFSSRIISFFLIMSAGSKLYRGDNVIF